MAIDLITGHQGVAHISAEQIAEIQRAELGGYGDSKVMRVIDGGVTYAGLTITVAAGYWRVNGFDMQIQEAEEILIDPTAAGNNRIDIIYATILQDIPSGVQRSELRVVQGEESASTPSAPTKPTAPILNTDELLQIEEVCRVTVSDGAMTFTDKTIPYQLANPQDIEDTQLMIAPIENGATASQSHYVGEHLIHNGILFRVIQDIAQGDTLDIATNISVSPSVMSYIEDIKNIAPKYGVSDTAASTTAKTASTNSGNFSLITGNVVRVLFTYENTAQSPTLNIDGTGAYDIKGYGSTKPDIWWKAGDVVEFTFDGTNYIMGASQGQIASLNASLTTLTSNIGIIYNGACINATINGNGGGGTIGKITLPKKGVYLVMFDGWPPIKTSFYRLHIGDFEICNQEAATSNTLPISACGFYTNNVVNTEVELGCTNWSSTQYSGKPILRIKAMLLKEL